MKKNKYFAKHLPKLVGFFRVIKSNGIFINYEKEVQLFLCSRDIQEGDNYQWQDGDGNIGHGIKITIVSPDAYKVIGPISPEATWVKEGDEFEEDRIKRFDLEALKRKVNLERGIRIKGPCGHFH